MTPNLLCWSSKSDMGSMAVEAESSCEYPVSFAAMLQMVAEG